MTDDGSSRRLVRAGEQHRTQSRISCGETGHDRIAGGNAGEASRGNIEAEHPLELGAHVSSRCLTGIGEHLRVNLPALLFYPHADRVP